MSYFLIYSADEADSLALRQKSRSAHLDWLRSDPNVHLHVAGPWLDDAGVMRGSLLIVAAEARADVEGWLAKDPYRLAGLTATAEIKDFIWAIGAPED